MAKRARRATKRYEHCNFDNSVVYDDYNDQIGDIIFVDGSNIVVDREDFNDAEGRPNLYRVIDYDCHDPHDAGESDCWARTELIEDPEVIERCRKEICDLFGVED